MATDPNAPPVETQIPEYVPRKDQDFLLTLQQEGEAYASAGWPTFPCAPNAKNPLTKNGFKDASADLEQVREWQKRWPFANVATPTGADAGVDVLDVDVKPDANGVRALGDVSLAKLVAEFGPLPKTWTQRTPSGGTQYFFKPVPGLNTSLSKLAPGIDVKAKGGYVLLPPSVIRGKGPDFDGSYTWLVHPSEVPLADMPQWLVEKLLKLQERTEPKKDTPLRDVKPTERNARLFQLGRRLRREGADEVAIGAAIMQANAGFAEPLESAEVNKIISSVIRQPDEKGWPAPPTAPEEKDLGGERFTDRENARLLEDFSDGEVRHADEMKDRWYRVGPLRWELDFKTAVVPYVQFVVLYYFMLRDQERDAASEKGKSKEEVARHKERAEAYHAAALRLESRAGVDACLELAKSMPGVRCKVADFDAHPLWLNTQTCTMDLETFETWEHRPTDMLTKVTGAGYDPTADAPTWRAFLNAVVPDAETQRFLQRAVGYCLSDLMSEQCMWFLYGLGRNGKTTFINAVRRMLGDYAMTTKASTLMVKDRTDDKRNDVAVLKGARFVSATEAEDGQQLAESLMKEITGQDPITARLMYAEFFTFEPTFKIWLAANHKPVIKGTDLAVWRRIHLVPFTTTIPVESVDRELPDKLYAERDGILNWALAGWRDYRASGLGVSPEVEQATAAYRAEMDPLVEFIEDACLVEPGASCTAADLYEAYEVWTRKNGVRYPLKAKTFGQQLTERGFASDKGNRGVRMRLGLCPKPRAVRPVPPRPDGAR